MSRLAVGSAAGSIRGLFAKIKAIDAKHGKFDLVLCTGDFFGPTKTAEQYTDEDDTAKLLAGELEGTPHYQWLQYLADMRHESPH